MGRIAVAGACVLALGCDPPALTSICPGALNCEPSPPATVPTDYVAMAARVRASTSVTVDGCDYLGDFVGEGSDRPGGSERDLVKFLAAEKGATDVVLYSNPRSVLVGKGYRCSSSPYGGQDAGGANVAE